MDEEMVKVIIKIGELLNGFDRKELDINLEELGVRRIKYVNKYLY